VKNNRLGEVLQKRVLGKNGGNPAGWYFLLIMFFLIWIAGCTAVTVSTDENITDCRELWKIMDEAIDREGAGDGSVARIEGFDYLRVDRFLLALAKQADSTRKQRVLIEKMRRLDLQHRYRELEFLSDEAWSGFTAQGYPVDEGVFKRQAASCSVSFMQHDRQDPDYFNRVMEKVDVNQDYSLLYRTLGLYPLTRLYVDHRIDQHHQDHPVKVDTVMPELARVIEPPLGRKMSLRQMTRILKNSRLKPFLDFRVAEQDLRDLVCFYAPVFQLGGDSFGRIVSGGEKGWQVDEHDPVVYYYLSQAILQDIPVLQINYVVWFNARREPAPWFTAGYFDGVTVRVTLDWQGRPLVYDSIANCGCYYFGVRNDMLLAEKHPQDADFQPYFAGLLPEISFENHFNVQIEKGSNLVLGVSSVSLHGESGRYTLVPYDGLEKYSKQMPRKFFNQRGIVENTERTERFFLFPMGIPNVGAMRQRGRQPITLVGQAYFDDPYLFDSVFVLKEEWPARKKLVKKTKKKQSNLQRRVESGKAISPPGRQNQKTMYW
jgi:hypothetical protein